MCVLLLLMLAIERHRSGAFGDPPFGFALAATKSLICSRGIKGRLQHSQILSLIEITGTLLLHSLAVATTPSYHTIRYRIKADLWLTYGQRK
jgi:hypothetical protein